MRRRPEKPTSTFADDFTTTRDKLLAQAIVIRELTEEKMESTLTRLKAVLGAAEQRVQGNRSGEQFATWEDLRLMLVNDLKILLDYLEGN